jgi:5-methylcytosine-specific restriction endonuclease McrA
MILNAFERFERASYEELQPHVEAARGFKDLWHRLGLYRNGKYGKPTASYKATLEAKGFDLSEVATKGRRKHILPKMEKNSRKPSKVLGLSKKEACRLNGLASGAKRRQSTVDWIRNNQELIFTNPSIWDGARVRRIVRLYNSIFNWFEYQCQKCGNAGNWCGEKLTLHLDHKNGLLEDNRFENLEYLCPNCHSQCPTFGAKNIRFKKIHHS